MRRLSAGAIVVGLTFVAGAAVGSTTSLGTPGLYADFAKAPTYTQLNYFTKVTHDPTPAANNGANVFWAHQFGNTVSGSGYIGFQSPKNARGGRQILFSVWGATACKLGDGHYAPTCVHNTDGDTGAGVRIFYPWKAGVKYRLTVRKNPQWPAWWIGYLYDPSTNVSHIIGALRFGGSTGGRVYPEGDFVEYYNWNDPKATCGQQYNSAAIFYPITGTGGTVPYTSTSHSSTCTYADHSRIVNGTAVMVATPRP